MLAELQKEFYLGLDAERARNDSTVQGQDAEIQEMGS